MIKRISLIISLLSPAYTAQAQPDSAAYGFPISNPFEATIATTPRALRPALPADVEIDQADYSLNLKVQYDRKVTARFVTGTGPTLRYRLARQSHDAPLVFIISGTGANYTADKTDALKRLLYKAGYHVIQLSSPTSFDFMSSASRSATPGITTEDAWDLYQVMKVARSQHPELSVTDVSLVGYSLGALQAAFVSHLDEDQRHFRFKRVALINPPVNLLSSIHNLDRLVQVEILDLDNKTTYFELLFEKLASHFRSKGFVDFNEALLFDLQQSDQRLSDEQLAMLIGSIFRFSAADIAFTSDLINRRGLITPTQLNIEVDTPLEPFFERALLCDFTCYINQQLMPYWKTRDTQGTLESLNAQASLYAIATYLRGAEKISVMHNADDFILAPGDLAFLQDVFRERLIVYPTGGHCGNMNYQANTSTLLELLRD